MTISSAVAALIKRMDEHPEEFVNEGWDPVVSGTSNYLHQTRWEEISELIASEPSPLFTKEEKDTYLDKLRGLLRARVDETIIKELVGYAKKNAIESARVYRDKQLNLPLGTSMVNAVNAGVSLGLPIRPTSILTTAEVTREALKIIGATYE